MLPAWRPRADALTRSPHLEDLLALPQGHAGGGDQVAPAEALQAQFAAEPRGPDLECGAVHLVARERDAAHVGVDAIDVHALHAEGGVSISSMEMVMKRLPMSRSIAGAMAGGVFDEADGLRR